MPEGWINISKRDGEHEEDLPSLCVDVSARIGCAWSAYERGGDRVYLRRAEGEKLSPLWTVEPEPGAFGSVRAVSDTEGILIAWCAAESGMWGVRAAWVGEEGPGSSFYLVPPEKGRLEFDLEAGEEGRIWMVVLRSGSELALGAVCGDTFQKEVLVAPPDAYRYRLNLTVSPEGPTCAWSEFGGGEYRIVTSGVDGKPVPIEYPGSWAINLTVGSDDTGCTWCAFQVERDRENEDGVADQHAALVAARRSEEVWEVFDRDAQGADLASLAAGLLPTIEPKSEIWGHYGRRCQPLLAPVPGGMWLLWERKAPPDGPTLIATGILCGRFFDGTEWGPVRNLAEGLRGYALSGRSLSGSGTRYALAALGVPGGGLGDLHLRTVDLSSDTDGEIVPHADRPGWRPVVRRARHIESRHTVESSEGRLMLFWGDPHVHSSLSRDCEGEPDELCAYARYKAGLDFLALTDNDGIRKGLDGGEHIACMSQARFEASRSLAEEMTEPGEFVVLPGFEWTCVEPHQTSIPRDDAYHKWLSRADPEAARTINHRSVLFRTPDRARLVRWYETPGRNIHELVAALEDLGDDCILTAHHHDFSLARHPMERNVEVVSGWSVYFDEPSVIHWHLAQGHRFGFVGGGDNHRRNPGMGGAVTGVYAPECTSDALFDALRNRRLFATSGARIAVAFRMDDALMGEEAIIERVPTFTARVAGIRSRSVVEIVKDGEPVCSREADDAIAFEWTDERFDGREHWYYLRVTPHDRPPVYPANIAPAFGGQAWSSPIWVKA